LEVARAVRSLLVERERLVRKLVIVPGLVALGLVVIASRALAWPPSSVRLTDRSTGNSFEATNGPDVTVRRNGQTYSGVLEPGELDELHAILKAVQAARPGQLSPLPRDPGRDAARWLLWVPPEGLLLKELKPPLDRLEALADSVWNRLARAAGLPLPVLKSASSGISGQVSLGSDLLGVGSVDSRVALAQDALAKLGYDGGKPDGVFGKKTRDAVIRFQKSEKLPADGVLGSATWDRLFTVLSAPHEHRAEPGPPSKTRGLEGALGGIADDPAVPAPEKKRP
jgi:hypothetical protein